MQKFFTCLGCILLALSLPTNANGANGVEKIPWAQLPPAVQKVAHAHIIRHGDVHKSTEDGDVFYDVRGMKNGKHVELSVTGEGKLLSVEQEMDMAKIPEAVQKALKQRIGESKVEKVLKKTEDDEVTYEAEVSKGDKDFTLDFGSAGEFLRIAEETSLAQIPAPAKKRIQAELGQGELGSISIVTEDGETNIEAEIVKGERSYDLKISPQGELLEMRIPLAETPPAVQKRIKERVGAGKIEEINKLTEEGEVFYEVDFSRDGKSRFVSVDADGELTSEEEEIALEKVPVAAQKAIKTELNGQKAATVTKRIEEGKIFYDVEFADGNQKREFSVSETGELEKDEK